MSTMVQLVTLDPAEALPRLFRQVEAFGNHLTTCSHVYIGLCDFQANSLKKDSLPKIPRWLVHIPI